MRRSHRGAWIDKPVTIACGQCIGCRLEQSRQWAVRMMHEAQSHDANSFITLTYDKKHLPNDGSLVLADWQKFAKRLRKRMGPFRFFHCGEYGDRNFRPHYHAAIFGIDFSRDRVPYMQNKQGQQLFESQTLLEVWGKGLCPIGELTFDSAGYIARYITTKKTGQEGDYLYGEKIDRNTGEVTKKYKPPYTTMSRRPGLGTAWLSQYRADVYPRDEMVINGVVTRPPRFYDRILERTDPDEHRRIKLTRQKQGEKHKDNNTYDRLKVRETVLKAKTKQITREL